ncbi:7587_t:CDS:2, partial [Gigaspora margarita]
GHRVVIGLRPTRLLSLLLGVKLSGASPWHGGTRLFQALEGGADPFYGYFPGPCASQPPGAYPSATLQDLHLSTNAPHRSPGPHTSPAPHRQTPLPACRGSRHPVTAAELNQCSSGEGRPWANSPGEELQWHLPV